MKRVIKRVLGRRHAREEPRLKRSLGLFDMTMYGVGMIIGAGIYALLGEGAGIAGNAVWMSFAIAAVVSAFTGLAYCELNSMMPKEAAEYNFTKKAFGRHVAFLVGWVLLLSMTVSASTVALGFAGYLSNLFPFIGVIAAAAAVVMLFSFLNFWGIKESSRFNIPSALMEVGGLVVVIAIGFIFFDPSVDFAYSPAGVTGVMSGAVLMFFAFTGFQDIANMSEEVKNARVTVPRAMLLSLAISTVLYILVSVAAIGIVGWENLSSTGAPMALILERAAGPWASAAMSFIALFSTANTVLICLIVASRMVYGMSSDGGIPRFFSRVHPKRKTPYIAVFLIMLASLGFVMTGDIALIANVTTTSVFISFVCVNLALIALRYKEPRAERPFRSPLNIGKFPIVGAIGIATSIAMLAFTDPVILAMEGALVLLGFLLYVVYRKTAKS